MKYPRFGFGEPRIGVRSSWLKFELLFRSLVWAVVRIRLLKQENQQFPGLQVIRPILISISITKCYLTF